MLKRLLAMTWGVVGLAACAIRPADVRPDPVLPAQLAEAAPKEASQDAKPLAVTETMAARAVVPAKAEAAPRPLEPLPLPPRGGLPEAFYPDAHRSLQVELASNDVARVALARAAIEAEPQAYPPYLYAALSQALLDGGERQEASFWYYASQLRARYDANRCNLSPSAERHARLLGDIYGKDIARDAIEQPARMAETVSDVLRFDEDTPNTYDPRWVYYLPLERDDVERPPNEVPPLAANCQPEDRWPLIKDATRMAYEREMAALIPGFTPARRTAALGILQRRDPSP